MRRKFLALFAALSMVGLGTGACRQSPGSPAPPSPAAPRPISAEAAGWRWNAPPRASVGMPAADSSAVAFTFGHLRVVLLDGNGTVQWEAERLGVRDVAPGLTSEFVLVATEEGVAAFDRDSGSVRWDAKVGERANTPTIHGGRAFVTTWDSSVYGFDLATGAVVWHRPLPGPALGPPAVSPSGEVVYSTWESDDGLRAGIVALNTASGEITWERPLEGDGVSAPSVLASGAVVLVAGDLAAHALDGASGDERWRLDTEGAGSPEAPPLALAGGEVLILHRLGGLVMADGGTGRIRWTVSTDGAAVRGGPVGPLGEGQAGDVSFAAPLDDGRVVIASAGSHHMLEPESPVSGLAVGLTGDLILTTAGGEVNFASASNAW